MYQEDLPYFGTAVLRLNCADAKNILISEVQKSGSKGREMISRLKAVTDLLIAKYILKLEGLSIFCNSNTYVEEIINI